MADSRSVSTLDRRVRIEKRETEFSIPAFQDLCNSCLTSEICRKVDADQSMNPENDPNLQRYKLCATQVLQVGVFMFEIGVDWPVMLEHEQHAGAAARNRQPPRRHVFLTDTTKKHHSINGHIRRVDSSPLEASIHCMMKLINTEEYQSQKKQTQKGQGGMFVLRPSTQIRAPFKVTLPEIFDPKKGWLHNEGELRVVYQLSMATEHDVTPAPCPKVEVCDAFLKLLDTGGGDVTLKVGVPHERIEAHSVVLGARSPVLEAMFTSGKWRESETKEAEFEDLDPGAVRAMVRYMYGGDLPAELLADDELTMAIMTAANYFRVQSLVDRCAWALRERFSVEKIAEFLKIADMTGCEAFKQACLEFLAEHGAEVEETQAYKDLVETRPSLLREVVSYLTGSVHKRRRLGIA
jgi:hypothetical protein